MMALSLAQSMALCGAVGSLPKPAPAAAVLDARALAQKAVAAPASVGRGKYQRQPEHARLTYLALNALLDGPQTSAEVNAGCGFKLMNPTASLNYMEGRGLVLRKPAQAGLGDSRLKWVYEITDAGRKLVSPAKNGV